MRGIRLNVAVEHDDHFSKANRKVRIKLWPMV